METLRERLKALADGVPMVGSAPLPQGVALSDPENATCVKALQQLIQTSKESGEFVFPPSGVMPLII